MDLFIEIIKAIFIGFIQGITEWLPVSSTGHMIIADEFVSLGISEEAWNLFEVITQLGSILAVIILFFDKLNPFSKNKDKETKTKTWKLWLKVIVACIPAAVIGFFLDDFLDKYLYNFITVIIALVVYGVLFIIIERKNKKKYDDPEYSKYGHYSSYRITDVYDIDFGDAFKIGLFQVLALIPGTSRSGSTILGSSMMGINRTASAEFSFFLAIPVMIGASALKIIKFGIGVGSEEIAPLTTNEIILIAVGTVVAFLVSLFAIKILMNFVKKNTFEGFGWYRIAFGGFLFVYYIIKILI